MPVVPEYTTTRLANGVMLHVLRGGAQPVVKIDVLLRAGTLRSDRPLVARAVANMLGEGTINHTSQQIADTLDFYGASKWTTTMTGYTVVSAMCLSRDTRPVVDLLEEIVKYPTFPQEELDIYIAQELQGYDVNILKTSYLAVREMLRLTYAEGDRNARVAQREDITALTPESLKRFHSLAYRPEGAHIFVCGQPTEDDVKIVADAFGQNWQSGGELWTPSMPNFAPSVQRSFIQHEGEQTSIRFTRRLFSRNHEQFLPFQVANVALGGYFGSRLMQNIRERLGLTYGISSYVNSNALWGTHSIGSEIRAGSHQKVIDEVAREMETLATTLIPDREMETLRGYMLGDILRYFDSVITSADSLFSLLVDEVPVSRVKEYYDVVKNITPSEVRQVAEQWLVPDDYSIACVGRMDV